MKKLLDKLPVLIFCCLFFGEVPYGSIIVSVIAFLSAVSVSALAQLLGKGKISLAAELAYTAACFFFPQFLCYFPLPAYDIACEKRYPLLAAAAAAFVYNVSANNIENPVLLLICAAAAVIFQLKTSAFEQLQQKYIHVRDSSAEVNMQLSDKNRHLSLQQDNEVRLATLKERNRIAREIHDNVGHLLSRSILQVEALKITCGSDELQKEGLVSLGETLNNAMSSVRQSVHNLYDESIDLKQAVLDAVKPLSEKGLTANTDLSFSGNISNELKFAFIAIVKEAAANIIKHSCADSVSVILREHPAFYQLVIEDNGCCSEAIGNTGIGLSNMRERIEKLGGIIKISSDKNGFRIFISVKK